MALLALDNDTDRQIQAAIDSLFRDCTIITVAHRVNSVADYDKVIAMDGGRIVECDSPNALLAKPNSYFYKMLHLQKAQK